MAGLLDKKVNQVEGGGGDKETAVCLMKNRISQSLSALHISLSII